MNGCVLLHGLGGRTRSLDRLQRALEREGYVTLNLGYPSYAARLEVLAEAIHPKIANFQERCERLHFVTHSMGGPLLLAYLQSYRPSNLGKVVAIAPPFGGSKLVDIFHNWAAFKLIFGPAAQQLGTSPSPVEQFGPADFPLGIIAGDVNLDLLAAFLLPRPHDGRVSVEKTRIEGAHHLTLHASHLYILYNRQAIQQTIHFISHGEFFNLTTRQSKRRI